MPSYGGHGGEKEGDVGSEIVDQTGVEALGQLALQLTIVGANAETCAPARTQLLAPDGVPVGVSR